MIVQLKSDGWIVRVGDDSDMGEVLADIQVVDDIDDELLDAVEVVRPKTLRRVQDKNDISKGSVTLS